MMKTFFSELRELQNYHKKLNPAGEVTFYRFKKRVKEFHTKNIFHPKNQQIHAFPRCKHFPKMQVPFPQIPVMINT